MEEVMNQRSQCISIKRKLKKYMVTYNTFTEEKKSLKSVFPSKATVLATVYVSWNKNGYNIEFAKSQVYYVEFSLNIIKYLETVHKHFNWA